MGDPVTFPHDDLPRSPSGRVPQWVVDEAVGYPVEPDAWRAYPAPEPPRRRRSLLRRLTVVVCVALVAWWGATSVLPLLLRTVDAPWLDGVIAGRVPEPTPEVAALAGEMFLTDEGRDLLYMTQPELLGRVEFAGRCDVAGTAGGAVGCYHSSAGGIQVGGRIVIYQPADPRLRGFVVETAAHELLHAAWNELDDAERQSASPALEAVVAGIDPADELHVQLAGSVGSNPQNRATELFAYVGTQVWRAGGLDPALEELYARYVADREALVGVHVAFTAQIDAMYADVSAQLEALHQRRYDQASAEAQLEADTATLAEYRSTIEQEEARLATLPASQRARSLLSWTWFDGTPLPQAPADELLADARALLARDEAAMAARADALRVSADEVAAEEARVDGLRVELESLYGELSPGS